METPQRHRTKKTPSVTRNFWVGLVLSVVTTSPAAWAQAQRASPDASLSEEDVIRLVREGSPTRSLAQATSDLVQARTRAAGLFPNPRVHWARETVETGPASFEDVVSATVPIDIARPLATRSLAAAESAWIRVEASLSRTEAVLEALLTYYEVAIAERRVKVLSQSLTNLMEAARILARREQVGTASGYERTRLTIASELSRSHLAEARGTLQSAEARLAALLGLRPTSLRIASSLTLIAASHETALAGGGVAARQAVRQAREAQRLADEAGDRSEWAWLPALELEAGMKHVSDQGSGYGYVVGASLSLPLFDHGQTLRAEAAAWQALSAARTRALTRTINAEVRSALVSFRAARQELARFEAHTSGQVEALLTAARSGYREGERTIVELLDAQRAQTDVAERRLDLLASAKRAEARLRAAAGEFQ